ncbi:hypothetical protein FKP32DRAFT_1639999 [Trametes sanguinea]|nr:hypothetical protein FKP32DRAFT_1639999 [Trametes sanguinea]
MRVRVPHAVAGFPPALFSNRISGAADTPMQDARVVPFQSPPGLERTFVLPHRGPIAGMAVPRGITMIAGGGFHVGPYARVLGADACATNFLVRDRRMRRLVSADPITPLVYKVRALLRDHGCSSILVIGGCGESQRVPASPRRRVVRRSREGGVAALGDYCDVADLVIEMRNYSCFDVTRAARQVALEIPSAVPEHEAAHFGRVRARGVRVGSLPSGEKKVVARKRTAVEVGGGDTLDLSALVQLVHDGQTRAIAAALKHLHHHKSSDSVVLLKDLLEDLEKSLDSEGLDAIVQRDRIDGFLARPRSFELAMAINRLVRRHSYCTQKACPRRMC